MTAPTDLFAPRPHFREGSGTVTFSTIGAGRELGEYGAEPHTVWWRLRPAAVGWIVLRLTPPAGGRAFLRLVENYSPHLEETSFGGQSYVTAIEYASETDPAARTARLEYQTYLNDAGQVPDYAVQVAAEQELDGWTLDWVWGTAGPGPWTDPASPTDERTLPMRSPTGSVKNMFANSSNSVGTEPGSFSTQLREQAILAETTHFSNGTRVATRAAIFAYDASPLQNGVTLLPDRSQWPLEAIGAEAEGPTTIAGALLRSSVATSIDIGESGNPVFSLRRYGPSGYTLDPDFRNWSVPLTPSGQYSPTDLSVHSGSSLLDAVKGPPIVLVPFDVAAGSPEAEDFYAFAWGSDQFAATYAAPAGSQVILSLSDPRLIVTYARPRFRYLLVTPEVVAAFTTAPLRQRQRDDGLRQFGRNGARSVQGSVRQQGRGGYA